MSSITGKLAAMNIDEVAHNGSDNNSENSDDLIHDSDVESVGDSEEAEGEPEFDEQEPDTESSEEGEGEGEGHVTDDEDASEEMQDGSDDDLNGSDGSEDSDDGEKDDIAAPSTGTTNIAGNAGIAGTAGISGIPVSSGGVTKPNRHKRKNPRKWFAEIKQMQASTAYMIQRAPFRRLVREIADDFGATLDFSKESFSALQTASEDYITHMFQQVQCLALHRKCVTIEARDIQMVVEQARNFRWF